MNENKRHTYRKLFTVLCLSTLVSGTHQTTVAASETGVKKLFKTTVNLFSVEPSNPLETYHWSGSGSFSWLAGSSGGGSVNLGLNDSTRSFRVKMQGKSSQERFIVCFVSPHLCFQFLDLML